MIFIQGSINLKPPINHLFIIFHQLWMPKFQWYRLIFKNRFRFLKTSFLHDLSFPDRAFLNFDSWFDSLSRLFTVFTCKLLRKAFKKSAFCFNLNAYFDPANKLRPYGPYNMVHITWSIVNDYIEFDRIIPWSISYIRDPKCLNAKAWKWVSVNQDW